MRVLRFFKGRACCGVLCGVGTWSWLAAWGAFDNGLLLAVL